MNTSDYNIFYLSPGSWYSDFHRKPLVRAIAKHNRVRQVYIIEVPADLFHAPLKNPKRLLHALKCFFEVPKEDKKIYVFTPIIFLHHLVAYKIPLFRRINILLFNKSLKRLLKREGIDKNIVLSIYRPEMIDFTNFHHDIMLIYDCYDEYLMTSQDKKIKKIVPLEKELIIKSDFVFTSSKKLLSKSLKYNKYSFLIHNAADTVIFGKAFLLDLSEPDDLKNLKRPLIGYIGVIRNWIDFELLNYVINDHPDKTFVFIGPCTKSAKNKIKKLKIYQNVFFLGQKKIENVPAYLKYFDVAIIPNKMTKFNQSVVPYKLFEYLAAGQKILTTNHCEDLKEFYDDYITIATDKVEFSMKLNNLIAENRTKQKRIFEFGQQQSWQNRVDEMFDIIATHKK